MPSVALSSMQAFRTGYTPVRVPTTFSTKLTGLMIWSRHCLILNAGVLIREIVDSILIIAPGDVDTVVVDPLSDTRVMKGDSQTPGAKLVRFMAFDGMNQDCRNVEITTPSMNPDTTSQSIIPVEYLRLRETLIDGQNPIAPSQFHTDIARGASSPFSGPAPWVNNRDWFLSLILNFEDLGDPDFCQRIVVSVSLGSALKARFKLPIPHLMIKAQMGDVLTQQLTLGIEMQGGVDTFQIEEEGTGQQPNICVLGGATFLSDVCSYRVDEPTTGMKLLRLREMLDSSAKDLDGEASKKFNPLSTTEPQARVTDRDGNRRRR